MKKIDVKELTSKLNNFISQNKGKSFTGNDLCLEMMAVDFSETMARTIQSQIFDYEKKGFGRLYKIASNQAPIYIGVIEKFFKERNNKAMKSYYDRKGSVYSSTQAPSEEEAWQILIDKGLVKKIFDINILKAKYPSIYLECLRYEIVK